MTEKITDEILRDFNMKCSENGLFLTKVLGEGSFGRVYSGTRSVPYKEDAEKKNQYAVKLTLDTQVIHEHLEREIRIQQELSHPNIVKIYQVIVKNNFFLKKNTAILPLCSLNFNL